MTDKELYYIADAHFNGKLAGMAHTPNAVATVWKN